LDFQKKHKKRIFELWLTADKLTLNVKVYVENGCQ